MEELYDHLLDILALMVKSFLHDNSGVSVIIGAMLLILITVVAAAGLALIVSQTEKQAADRQALQNAVNSEQLKIASMTITNGSPPDDKKIDNLAIDIMNMNTAQSKIMAVVINGKYVTNYTIVSGSPDFTANVTSGLPGLTVQFNDMSHDSPTGLSWDFGDTGNASGDTANIPNPVYTYKTPGNYSVTLKATVNTGSDQVTKINYIQVKDPSLDYNVDFSSDVQTGPVNPNLTVHFYGHSTFPATSWHWDFGDGNISSQQNPTYNYTSPGSWDVTLTVNGAGHMTKSKYIIAGTDPIGSFTDYLEPNNGMVPTPVDFVDTSYGHPTSWDWDFGDGSPHDNSQNPTHVYDTPGSYIVTLNVNNAYGTSIPYTQTIKIPSLVQTSMPLTIDGGAHSHISFNQTLGNSHGLGITTDQPITIQIVTSYVNYFKTIYNPPSAIEKVNVETQNLGLRGSRDYVVLDGSDSSSTNGTIVSWNWDIHNLDKTINIPLVGRITKLYPPTNDGYIVSLTVIDSNGMTSTSDTTSIPSDSYFNPIMTLAPVADFIANGSPVPLIANGSPVPVQFTDTSSNNPTSWSWYFGDGSQSTEQNPVHVYYTGNWTVSLIATNEGGSNTTTKYGCIRINQT